MTTFPEKDIISCRTFYRDSEGPKWIEQGTGQDEYGSCNRGQTAAAASFMARLPRDSIIAVNEYKDPTLVVSVWYRLDPAKKI